jgi:hypothetical protein
MLEQGTSNGMKLWMKLSTFRSQIEMESEIY